MFLEINELKKSFGSGDYKVDDFKRDKLWSGKR